MDEPRKAVDEEAEALLGELLMERIRRHLTEGDDGGDLEVRLRQAGAAYRERVEPLRADELKAAMQRMSEEVL